MAIDFACSCGKQYRVKDEAAGRSFDCRECGLGLMVPRPDPEAPPDPAETRLDAMAGRLDRLQRSNGRLTVLAILGPILAGAVGVLAASRGGTLPASPPPDPVPAGIIEAKGLVIRDEAGRVRASLGYDGEKAVGLKLFEGGDVRTEYRVWDNGVPATIFYYLTGAEAVNIGGGGIATPSVEMYDIKGDERVNLEVFDTGEPILTMSDKDLDNRFQLGVNSDGLPYFDFFDLEDHIVPVLDKGGRPLFYPQEGR